MNKRKALYIIIALTIIIYMIYQVVIYCNNSIDMPVEDMIEIRLKQPKDISKESIINSIKQLSNEYGTNIIYRHVDGEKGITYYDVQLANSDEDYSNSEYKNQLVGFFIGDMDVALKSIDELISDEIEYISGSYYIEKEYENQIVSRLRDLGMDVDITESGVKETIDEVYIIIMGSALLFCILAIILYVYTRSKEIAICKSVGIDNIHIAFIEVKKIVSILIVVYFILMASFIILSVIFDLKSTLDFIAPLFIKISLFCCIIFIMVFFVSFTISVHCDMQVMKGKRTENNLLYILYVSKICIIIGLVFFMSTAIKDVSIGIREYIITKKNLNYIKDFAMLELCITEDTEDVREERVDDYLELYHLLDEKYGLVISHMHFIEDKKYIDVNKKYKRTDINSNYIDYSDTIFNLDGTKLTSSQLEKDKINILVPESYDEYNQIHSNLIDCQKTGCEINYIRYSEKSRFFTYFNDTELSNYGYSSNLILEVFDPDLIIKYCPRLIASDDIQAAFTWGAFFRIDSANSRTPYDQIYPLIRESGVPREEFSAIRADEQFYETLYYIKRQLILDIVCIVLLFLALIILCSETAFLYYKENRKKILLKILHGFMYKDTYKEVLLLNCIIIFLVSGEIVILKMFYIINEFYSIIAGCVCMVADNILFYLSMKRHCSKNIRFIDKEG